MHGADAAFASRRVSKLREAEGFLSEIHLPANRVLQVCAAHLRARTVGRPPNPVPRPCASICCRAKSWDKARRVVAEVAWIPGEIQ